MSKQYEKREVKETRNVLVGLTCDLCGYVAKHNFDNWGVHNPSEVAQTEVSLRDGIQYPENGSGDKVEIDICPKCFKTKLIPWLQSQGASIKEQEWDY